MLELYPSMNWIFAMNRNLSIRHPLKSEYDRIADLWLDSWLSTGLGHTANVTKDDLRKRLETEAGWELLIGVKDEQIIGMLAIKRNSSKLDQLFVHPEYQRQGIGRHLLFAAKALLPSGMWLKAHRSNSAAIHFYRSEGFVLDCERTKSHGDDADVFYRWAPPN